MSSCLFSANELGFKDGDLVTTQGSFVNLPAFKQLHQFLLSSHTWPRPVPHKLWPLCVLSFILAHLCHRVYTNFLRVPSHYMSYSEKQRILDKQDVCLTYKGLAEQLNMPATKMHCARTEQRTSLLKNNSSEKLAYFYSLRKVTVDLNHRAKDETGTSLQLNQNLPRTLSKAFCSFAKRVWDPRQGQNSFFFF